MTTFAEQLSNLYTSIAQFGPASVLIEVVIILIAAIVCQLVVRFSLRRLKKYLIYTAAGPMAHRQARASTLTRVLRSTLSAVIWTIAILMMLDAVGISIAPFIASAGIVGLAVSFGAQEMIRDGFTGFFFILENQFNVGSYLQIADKKGVVIKMDLRTVTLRDDSNEAIYIFRNSQIGVVSKFDPEVEAKTEQEAKEGIKDTKKKS